MRWLAALPLVATLLAPTIARAEPKAVLHVVQRGETLSSIAKRFDTNVSSICRWNGIKRNAMLAPGRKIGVPLPPGSHAAAVNASGDTHDAQSDARTAGKTWRDYIRLPRNPGTITLKGYDGTFSGHVLASDGSVEPDAYAAINALMAPGHDPGDAVINRDLIKLMVQVSDIFGGRPLELVSGYRPGHHSRHAFGAAMDFRIEGVPNWALRDYALTLDKVGVGYYPNSTHVHLDVRERKTTWVDLSRPGQRAHYVKPSRSAKASKRRSRNRKR
jgi:LysM repeat protein